MTSPETEFVSIIESADNPAASSRISARSLPDAVPILGLSDIVIFPGAIVPLLIETGPSLKLIDDIVAGDRLFGAVLQRKPEVAEPAPEDLYEVGCVSRLSKMVKFPRRHRPRAGRRPVAHPREKIRAARAVSASHL